MSTPLDNPISRRSPPRSGRGHAPGADGRIASGQAVFHADLAAPDESRKLAL